MSNKTVLQLPTIAEINKEKGRAFIYAGLEATEFLPEEDRKIPYSELPGTVQVVQSNITAKLDALYHTVATCTITDPTPFEGKGYVVRVINGTTTISGTDYTPGQIVVRTFHSGSWVSRLYDVVTGANIVSALGYTPENVANKATTLVSPNNTTYPTTQAVVNETKKTTITVELIDLLTTNFYAPNALRINSTALISGSGTITLKVNDVAYTLGNLIIQGEKITVETTTASVYNLIGIYE